ncbi:ABC transporter permease [Zhihengliuella somnathii]
MDSRTAAQPQGADGESEQPGRVERPDKATVTVNMSRLQRVGQRKGLWTYLREVWQYRHFIFYDSRARVETRNEGSALGNIWLVLTPVLNGLTYFLVFGLLLGTRKGVDNFLGFLIIGVFMFSFTSRSINAGARSIQQGRSLITSFRFPRISLPIAVTLRESMAFLPAAIAMIVMVIVLPEDETITWRWLLIVPILALQVLFNLGLSLVLARAVASVRDVGNLLPFATRIWLYSSGVFYSVERFTSDPTLLTIISFNPLFQVLEMTRDVILYEAVPGWDSWAILGGWAVILTLIGIVYFWQGEEKYGMEGAA